MTRERSVRKDVKDAKRQSLSPVLLAAMMMAVVGATIGGVNGVGTSDRLTKAGLFAIAATLTIVSLARPSSAGEARLYRPFLMVAVMLFAISALWFLATAWFV